MALMKSMTSEVISAESGNTPSFGERLRGHRRVLGWSQERLGFAANVSSRHVSCLESGKAQPSRAMVLRLSNVLRLALRERNTLLVSAGFAGVYAATPLHAQAMASVNRAVDLLLAQQSPYPALAIDRCWNVLRVNDGARRLLDTFLDAARVPAGVAANVVKATLHPEGLRPHIVNWCEVASLLLERVERAVQAHPTDDERRALRDEIRTYPGVVRLPVPEPGGAPAAALRLRHGAHDLTLFACLTTIGTPLDLTTEELTLESLFPADDATELWFRTPPPRNEPGGR